MKFTFALLFILGTIVGFHTSPCAKRKLEYGIVCVCTEDYCDTLEDVDLKHPDEVVVLSTSESGLRFEVSRGNVSSKYGIIPSEGSDESSTDSSESVERFKVNITVNRTITYQKHIGFGGAFTGAVSHIIDKLTTGLQHHIYKSYFSLTEGIAYNLMRMPIGGSDFDLAPWAYNELPTNDADLSNFTKLDDRDLHRLTQLKDLKNVTDNYDIKYIGAAWSPPPWMKTNNDWSGQSALKLEYYMTWAKYHLQFLELMALENETFWAISTGNEPLNGELFYTLINFMSLGWSPATQAHWVGEYLGPLLRNSSMKNVKLLGADDQRYVFPFWFLQMEDAHPESVETYLDGFAVHWYWDEIAPPRYLDQTNELFPDKFILNTESCIGDKPWELHGPMLGSWDRADQYAKSYIEDLNHWVVGWVDWNIILDESGGPNYANNTVDSPVIVNTTSKVEFYKQPMFYVIGHFSRFIVEDSIRIDVQSSDSSVETVGYQRPDNTVAIVLFNRSLLKAKVTLRDGDVKIKLLLPPRSIHTVVYF